MVRGERLRFVLRFGFGVFLGHACRRPTVQRRDPQKWSTPSRNGFSLFSTQGYWTAGGVLYVRNTFQAWVAFEIVVSVFGVQACCSCWPVSGSCGSSGSRRRLSLLFGGTPLHNERGQWIGGVWKTILLKRPQRSTFTGRRCTTNGLVLRHLWTAFPMEREPVHIQLKALVVPMGRHQADLSPNTCATSCRKKHATVVGQTFLETLFG